MADADAATAGACRSVATWRTHPSDETISQNPIYSSTGVGRYTATSTKLDLGEGSHASSHPFLSLIEPGFRERVGQTDGAGIGQSYSISLGGCRRS
jgi:hypothetical protein